MQFIGYLAQPNDPRDTDYTGYSFWHPGCGRFNSNYINAEMVRAFISSIGIASVLGHRLASQIRRGLKSPECDSRFSFAD